MHQPKSLCRPFGLTLGHALLEHPRPSAKPPTSSKIVGCDY
jgi:hypothetical protein